MSDKPIEKEGNAASPAPEAAPAVAPSAESKEVSNSFLSDVASQLGLKEASPEAVKAAISELQKQSRQDSTARELEMLAYANERAPLLNLAKRHSVAVSDTMSNSELRKAVALKISPSVARRDSVSDDYYQAIIDTHSSDGALAGIRQPARKTEKRTDSEPDSVSELQRQAILAASQEFLKQHSS